MSSETVDANIPVKPSASASVIVQQETILILTQIGFFIFGWFFFRAKLFKDYEVKRILVQILFSITFTLSCGMFELTIFEILDILDRK